MAQEPFDPLTPSQRGRSAQGEADTSAIKRDIERTRVEMSDTLGQIQERLRPDQLLQQAKDGVKDAVTEAATDKVRSIMSSAGETAHTVATRARGAGDHLANYVLEHPIRAAITAGVVAWLVLRGRDRTIDWEGESETAWQDDGEYLYEERRSLRDKVGDYASSARSTVGEYASTARETVGEYASAARQSAGEYAHSAREGAQRARERVRSAAGAATTSVDDWASENPLAAGAIAAAVGIAIGLSVPRTEAEDRVMGETRDAAWHRASRVAAGIKDNVSAKVIDAAENFVDTKILAPTRTPIGRA